MNRIKMNVSFAWYDLLIGAYIDKKQGVLYVCPFPCCVIKIWREKLPEIDIRVNAVMDALHRLSRRETTEAEKALRDMRDYAESLRDYVWHRLHGYDCK